ncbi:hypothetical protein GYMLUDRAFT_42664 [Collybiopsis luxurians FD-317 M1]|uniref:Uncharacterized protein n=1 Tax=Collybiopsis luxurians FD-317 M1 TaxID=944289 RepID=A0A0D0CYW5_9AGAR|nr:hypothetical protein GYMLUDRAFT_42664 [Collybiopsis luxurians FD-317 M1]
MAHDNSDVFSSQFLSTSSAAGPRRSPSRQSLNSRRSTASLRASSSLAQSMDQDTSSSRFSLAHELAAALMPEPSAGSRLLAEEFGIEYDEGAEGIDEDIHNPRNAQNPQLVISSDQALSFADELNHQDDLEKSFHDTPEHPSTHSEHQYDPVFGSPSVMRQKKPKKLEHDAMEVLAQDLESTDKFLAHLRRLDNEPGAASSASQQPSLEKIAYDVIRRLDETTRDREGQVRELLEYEREFRKIAGQVGGEDVLGQLEELAGMEELLEVEKSSSAPLVDSRLDSVEEEEPPQSQEWDADPHRLDQNEEDEDADYDAELTPVKDTFPPPPPILGPPTPASTIPQLAHLRSFTRSLVSSLTTISEQAQVNGVATTEAGRKIRALKNKLGTWRTDWDSAEHSRIKIERWEAGFLDGVDTPNGDASPAHRSSPAGQKRMDGRRIVQEHLQAFELALAEAGTKTQAIMASG